MLKKIAFISLVAIAAISCKPGASQYVDFLYESMPLPDSLVFGREYWEANVQKTLEVRDRMGWNVPEREFRHFVLPLRVNNENLDDFRTVYADSLCARVQGMSMAQAALEINHWCHERATYVPSDGRTLGPMALIRSGLGRCGEESVLAVSALRAAGIPARQVYTPRWAHTDDNHAWVEVFVDGAWHFMGACEPEPVLDLAWFNSSVSRAMLLHTKVFGNYQGPEDVISRTSAYTEINCIKSYIPTRRSCVVVRDTDGNVVPDADVLFCIYNYAEFYPVAHYKSSDRGLASLDTGIGDMVVWAGKDGRFGLAVVPGGLDRLDCGTVQNPSEVVLDKTVGQDYSFDLDIVPPVEDPLPNRATAQQIADNALRLEQENAMREAREHPRTADPGLFLSAKDAIDIDQAVIDEILAKGLTGDRYIDCPRVELEMLMPCRAEISGSAEAAELVAKSKESAQPLASLVASWVKDNVKLDELRNPQGLRIPPVAVWRGRIADARSRDIFFVAMCRSLGCAARLDEATSRPEYLHDGKWVSVDFGQGTEQVKDKGTLQLVYNRAQGSPVRTPKYYYNYTISAIENGIPVLCEYDENGPVRSSYSLDGGYFMLTSGTRLADGSVLAHVELFTLPAAAADGKQAASAVKEIVLRSNPDRIQVIGSMDAEQKFLRSGDEQENTILNATGRGYFMLCVTGVHDEPTIHAIGQLENLAQQINDWGRAVIVLDGVAPKGLDNLVQGSDIAGKVYSMLCNGVEMDGPMTLPLVAVADSFGRIVYLSRGYNTSMESQLAAVLNQL